MFKKIFLAVIFMMLCINGFAEEHTYGIEIVKARGLVSPYLLKGKTVDPYGKIFKSKIHSKNVPTIFLTRDKFEPVDATDIKFNTLSPVWNHELNASGAILFEVWDKNEKMDRRLGMVQLNLAQMRFSDPLVERGTIL